jgi:hypothetical protein
MAAQQFFIFLTRGLCALRHTESGRINGGTVPLGNIALNPYKQAISLHQWVIKNSLVQYRIGAM